MGEISVPTEEFAMLNRQLESSGFGSVCSDCSCIVVHGMGVGACGVALGVVHCSLSE